MKESLSFDRAAGYYDSTREFSAEVAARGIEAILEAAGPGARLLEVGAGTGRVSVPLLQRGVDLIGCDISVNMMSRLRQKFATARLVEADASRLPFPADQFGAVITSHVMHLVGPWRVAVREYRRVLKHRGVYINVHTEKTDEESPRKRIRDYWESRVTSYGATARRPGVENDEELHAELHGLGAVLKHVEVGTYSRSYSVRDTVDDIANRIHSSAWVVPDEIFARTVSELREWAGKEFKDPDARLEEQSLFVLDIAQFGGHEPQAP
jgi:ubiquinone/menaquinone biosynthesis C-methylase UbiE